MSEIYVVKNYWETLESEIVYVGSDPDEAQQLCDHHQCEQEPCLIQVWEDGEQQYVTRMLDEVRDD